MKFLLGLSILIILIFMGKFYYSSCKNTADEFVHKYMEEKSEMHKEDGKHGENSDFDRTIRA
jgi:hypothetical protein